MHFCGYKLFYFHHYTEYVPYKDRAALVQIMVWTEKTQKHVSSPESVSAYDRRTA